VVADLDTVFGARGGPRSLRALAFPRRLDIAVIAPHPDDFDAIGASLRHLHAQGHAIELAVMTAGASGVEDGYAGAATAAQKAALREQEQRASCAFFGLPSDRLHFLRLWETEGEDEFAGLRGWLAGCRPDLLFLPHGNDSNRTHRRTFEAVHEVAAEQGLQAWACLNRDAKTLQMRVDLFCEFDNEEAAWKAQLLRCHRSQQDRNLRTRGMGFDDRVLQVNRQAAQDLGCALPYAEVFELMRLA
jgi:LmbE family N-acetylglucosaminyl deacetylase